MFDNPVARTAPLLSRLSMRSNGAVFDLLLALVSQSIVDQACTASGQSANARAFTAAGESADQRACSGASAYDSRRVAERPISSRSAPRSPGSAVSSVGNSPAAV